MRLELYGCPWSKLLAFSAAKIAKVFSFDFFLKFQFSKEINCLVGRQFFLRLFLAPPGNETFAWLEIRMLIS